MSKIKDFAVMCFGAPFGGSFYDSLINAPNHLVGIPKSLEHFRLFMSAANLGGFFRAIKTLLPNERSQNV